MPKIPSTSQNNFNSKEDLYLTPSKTKESNGCICGFIVSILSFISCVIQKIASIFCCCLKGFKKNGAELEVKKINGVVDQKDLISRFEKACQAGNIEEASKFLKSPLISNEIPIRTPSGSVICTYPIETSFLATLSGDPHTKDNRLTLAKQLLERDPGIATREISTCPEINAISPYAGVQKILFFALISQDYQDFVPLLLQHGMNLQTLVPLVDDSKNEGIIQKSSLFAISLGQIITEKDPDKLGWFLALENTDLNSHFLRELLTLIVLDIKSPSRTCTLESLCKMGNGLLKKAQGVEFDDLHTSRIYGLFPYGSHQANFTELSEYGVKAKNMTAYLKQHGFTKEFANKINALPDKP